MTKKSDPTRPSSLKNLALSHLGYLTKAAQDANPKLSPDQAYLVAVQTKEGLEARRIYNLASSAPPWDQAIGNIVKRELAEKAELAKAEATIKTISPYTEATR